MVVSTQHDDEVSTEELRAGGEEAHYRSRGALRTWWIPAPAIHINPTGRFVIGGPHGDTGLTGRKIIVDTYGGMGRHGGGAFSGKDPTKVDRSACYMARYVAKNMVAAGLATRCEVQLAYAIGVAEPVSVMVNTFGTGQVEEERLVELVREIFPLTPKGMIEHLKLSRPIYRKTAAFGHFGRTEATSPGRRPIRRKLCGRAVDTAGPVADSIRRQRKESKSRAGWPSTRLKQWLPM